MATLFCGISIDIESYTIAGAVVSLLLCSKADAAGFNIEVPL